MQGASKDVRTNERIYDLHRFDPVGTRNGVKNDRMTEREKEIETERDREIQRQRERGERERREREREIENIKHCRSGWLD